MQPTRYYGICFPNDFALSPEVQCQLAESLFFSLSISALDAESIIKNDTFIRAINLITDKLACEIIGADKGLSFQQPNYSTCGLIDYSEVEDFISHKVYIWQEIFGALPTDDELLIHFQKQDESYKKIITNRINKTRVLYLKSAIEIAAYLKKYIIGQDAAIEQWAVMVAQQKQRLNSNLNTSLPKLAFPLIIGLTGVGKSYLVSKSKDILDVPYLRINCGQLVPAGIVGLTVSKAMAKLYKIAENDLDAMNKAIIHFDEIDKLAKSNHRSSDFKTSILFELLNLVEGDTSILFPENHKQSHDLVEIKTNNMFIVFSGAFTGIEEIIMERLNREFSDNPTLIDRSNIMSYIISDDLIQYGLIPEIVSRMSNTIILNNLEIEDYSQILKNSEESVLLKHIQACNDIGIHVSISNKAIQYIAQLAINKKLGARSLDSLVASIFSRLYFEPEKYAPEYKLSKKTIEQILSKYKYSKLYNDFKAGIDLFTISRNYNMHIDDVFDIYLDWKNITTY